MPSWTKSTKTVPAQPDDDGLNHVPAPFGLRSRIPRLGLGRKRLFAAIARCNLSKGVPRRVVMAEARAAAEWLSEHVSEKPKGFELQSTVNRYKDFVRTGKIGQLAAGIGYLYMIARGYPFVMHWEDAPARPSPRNAGSKTAPDFIFVGVIPNEWVLMESKGTISGSLNDMKKTAHQGYTAQVDPYVEAQVGNIKVSHGFVVGVHATPGTAASLCVVRTPLRQAVVLPGGPATLNRTAIVRSCYRATLALMALDQAVTAIDRAEPLLAEPDLVELGFGSGKVLVDRRTLEVAQRAAGAADEDELASPFAGLFGLEKRIGNAVIEALKLPANTDTAAAIEPLSADEGQSMGEEVSVFPDGLVWIPLKELKAEVENKSPLPIAPSTVLAQTVLATNLRRQSSVQEELKKANLQRVRQQNLVRLIEK